VWGPVVLPDLYIFFFEHQIFTSSDEFFILLEFKFHGTPCMCPSRDTPLCLKIPSSLLHMELTPTQVYKYDFSNRHG